MGPDHLESVFPSAFNLHVKAFDFLKTLNHSGTVGFKEFTVLADKMTKQDGENVYFLLLLLSINLGNDIQVLENFFLTIFEMFSDAQLVFKPNFRLLYLNLANSQRSFTARELTSFVIDNFPLVEKLLHSYFCVKFFKQRPSYTLFRPSSICYRSFISVPQAFGLYLTNS